MGRATSGILSAVRFANFACMFFIGGFAASVTMYINKYPSLRHPPNPPDIYLGHLLGAVFGILGGLWSFLAFIRPCTSMAEDSSSRPSSGTKFAMFCSALIDLMLTVGLTSAAIVHARYLPNPVGTCTGLGGQVGYYTTGERPWLDILAKMPVGQTGVPMGKREACTMTVTLWRMEIAMATISAIESLVMWAFVLRTMELSGRLGKIIRPSSNS